MRWTDEHVSYEVCLPSNFHDEANFHASVFICTAKSVYYIYFFSFRKLIGHTTFTIVKCYSCTWAINCSVPPKCVFSNVVLYKVFVFWRTSCKFTCVNRSSTTFC